MRAVTHAKPMIESSAALSHTNPWYASIHRFI
jgi:hypothetical protein